MIKKYRNVTSGYSGKKQMIPQWSLNPGAKVPKEVEVPGIQRGDLVAIADNETYSLAKKYLKKNGFNPIEIQVKYKKTG